MRAVVHHGVEVPEQEQAGRAGAAEAPDMSSAWSGVEQGTRSTSASPGRNAVASATHSSAAPMSPDGDDTATSASSSRSIIRSGATKW